MFDAAVKALAQMFTPPFRAVLLEVDRARDPAADPARHRPAPAVRLARRRGRAAISKASPDPACRRRCMRCSGCWRSWPASGSLAGAIFIMPAVTAFVASFFSDEIAAEVEHAHYPADPPGVPVPVWTRRHRGHQDRAAGAAGLSVRGAVPAVRRLRLPDLLRRERLPARARIFPARRDALSFGRGGEGAAQAASRHDRARRRLHRGVRVDPDPESGDAAVRHGVHGAHAQEASPGRGAS